MPEPVLFDRYRLLDRAGRGGSAEVWRARDERTGEIVAVKRLHPLVVADDASRRRLRREFDALRALDEPHVVRVRDLEMSDREAALVLDFVPGESLADRLATERDAGERMSPNVAVAIVEDVAAALAAAHAAGIVHRDVTPGNILLTPEGEARLTDFGIAHATHDAATAVTATGLVMGTLRYLAPEQLQGAETTPASDLHALAAVAYEMLAGRPAYAAATPVALIRDQEAGPLPIAGVPPALDAAVRAGLAADPADRPRDVRAFADSLRAALDEAVTTPMAIAPADRTVPLVVPTKEDDPVAARRASERSPAPVAATAPLSRGRGLPAPAAAILVLVFAVVALAAASGLDRSPPGAAGGSVGPSRPQSATPTARPATPAATAKPAPGGGGGKHHGGGKGHGKGEGD